MSITLLDDCHAIVLRTTDSVYAICWAQPDAPLRHLHWGPPVSDDDVRALITIDPTTRSGITAGSPRAVLEEFPYAGGLRREEVAIKLELSDGVRSLDLAVRDVAVTGQHSVLVTLVDTFYPVRLELLYRLDESADAIVRSASITNTGAAPLHVDQAFSASWPVPARATPTVLTLSGMYGAESRVTRNPLIPGRFTLESRSGIPGHDALPFVAIDAAATERAGDIWSVALAWSGSWKIVTQLADDGGLHIVGGVNDFDLRHALAPGAVLELPAMTGIHSTGGLTGMSRRWHRFQRNGVVPDPQRPRPVHFNSWEVAFFDISFDQQLKLATSVAGLGVELFVIDDGWFVGRNSDTAGLGDWSPDPVKFPDGIRPLADAVHELGMQFGLWVEPEMVNEDSELFRAHPDWIYQWPNRPRTYRRNQLMLDFSRPDVQDWAIDLLDSLIRENRLDYFKWDMNRPLSEPNSSSVADGGSVWIEHVHGLYRVWDELRTRHPDLWIESCASGGGRADLGTLHRTHWAWPSDNTDPLERLEIQHGFSMLNLPMTMASWVTDSAHQLGQRDTPLRFRFHVSMCGVLAIGGKVPDWSDADRALASELIALYKDIRPLVQFGELFRLDSPTPGLTTALSYVAENHDRAVVFIFAQAVMHTSQQQLIRLRGLDQDARYRLTHTGTGEASEFSGSFLQGHGALIPLTGHYDSAVLLVDRV